MFMMIIMMMLVFQLSGDRETTDCWSDRADTVWWRWTATAHLFRHLQLLGLWWRSLSNSNRHNCWIFWHNRINEARLPANDDVLKLLVHHLAWWHGGLSVWTCNWRLRVQYQPRHCLVRRWASSSVLQWVSSHGCAPFTAGVVHTFACVTKHYNLEVNRHTVQRTRPIFMFIGWCLAAVFFVTKLSSCMMIESFFKTSMIYSIINIYIIVILT